jgi:hypothetical protein
MTRRNAINNISAAVLLACSAAPAALANFIETNVNYNQVGPSTVNATNFSFELNVSFNTPGDYSGATVSYPGTGSPATMAPENSTSFFLFQGFSTLSALHAAFGFGTYNVALSAGNLPATTLQIAYAADSFPAAVPALSASTFSALNGLDPSTALAVVYNASAANTSNDPNEKSQTFFTIRDAATNAVVLNLISASSSTGTTIPANTLLANHKYSWDVAFESYDFVSTSQGNFQIASVTATDGSFTTGGIPEPATAGLAGIGLLAYAVFRRVRKRSHVN